MNKPKAFDFIIGRIKCLKVQCPNNNKFALMANSKCFLNYHFHVLQKLNGTEILEQERRGAEYDYMKCYGREWVAAVNNPVLLREFQSHHPRYVELVESMLILHSKSIVVIFNRMNRTLFLVIVLFSLSGHGSITEEDISEKPAPLKSRLINVRIFCPSNSNMPEFKKRVPKNMTVQKLSGLVQKLMDTGGSMPVLQAISAKVCNFNLVHLKFRMLS